MSEEVKTDHLTIKVKKSPGCQVELDVTVSQDGTKNAEKTAIKRINKEVSLPGFRKGKAPAALVIEHYKKHVDQEWKDVLIRTTFSETLSATNLYPLSEQAVQKPKVISASVDEGAQIVFTFECSPETPLIDPDAFSIKEIALKETKKEEIEREIEELILSKATWNEITDRGVEPGDMATIDVENLDAPDEPIAQDARLEVKETEMGQWLFNLLLGKKVGESAIGVSEKSPELDPEVKFIPTKCKVTVKKIEQTVRPELNEEFVKQFGVETVDQFKQRAKDLVEKRHEEEKKLQYLNQLDAQIAEKYPFDLPTSLVNTQKVAALRERTLPKDLPEEQKKEIEKEIVESIEKELRANFLLRKLAHEHKLSVDKQAFANAMIMQLMNPANQQNPKFKIEEVRSEIYMDLLKERAKELILERATIEPLA